jgi:hypothetical protein
MKERKAQPLRDKDGKIIHGGFTFDVPKRDENVKKEIQEYLKKELAKKTVPATK